MDQNVLNLVTKIRDRSVEGEKKYQTTTERKDLSRREWLTHAQEELTDAAVYIERLLIQEEEPEDWNTSFDHYQALAKKTRFGATTMTSNALGLAGESGEVVDLIKKIVTKRKSLSPATKRDLVLELGDVLWYVAALCDDLKISMGDVAAANIEKLTNRHQGEQL